MDFKKITDALYARITSDDLAKEAGVPVQSMRQARMDPEKGGKRPPPPGWAQAALRLAEKQAKHFQKLAEKIRATE